jgi:hypothetical protein
MDTAWSSSSNKDDVPKSPARFIPGALPRHTVCLEFRGFFGKVEFHFLK